jgi:putative endopeptidase
MFKKWIAFSAIVTIVSCNNNTSNSPDHLLVNLDTTVSPSEDFFMYANGGWIKNNKIPDAESGWGIGNLVQEDIYKRLIVINEKAVKENAAKGTITQKIGDFWKTAMDSIALNKNGITPFKNDLERITKATSIDDLLMLSAEFSTKGSGTFFSYGINQDDKNSNQMIFTLWQGGIGLPNRDYYFEKDEKSVAVQNAFKAYLVKIFKQLGSNDADATNKMNAVFALETKLANASRKLAALRDPYKNYNKMATANLQKLASNINWNIYLKTLGINNLDSVVVGQPEFYTALNNELKATPLDVWKNYMQYNYVIDFASYADDKTFADKFAYNQSINGAKQPRPRWKRALQAQDGALGEALGQLFVKEYFDATAKKRYEDMVEAVREAYKKRIENLPWMSKETKEKAFDKLAKMKKKVGYPDKWKDFSAMQIATNSYVENVQNANKWWHNYRVNKLGKPVNRDEWEMNPQEYNAYYNPSNNEIVLPAGIFAIPGKKDSELDDALVYGYAAASTIGHEITHGFDDQGRQYDAEGNLKDWWTKSDGEEFKKRAQKIINQFNEFIPVDTLRVNGDATQGENIADLGGLLIGLDAFKKTNTYKEGKLINGQTPLQRYFLGYAYAWMYQTRKESLANQVKTDVHSPAKERVNGPVVSIPEFYEAFGVKSGSKMYRVDSLRVNIW